MKEQRKGGRDRSVAKFGKLGESERSRTLSPGDEESSSGRGMSNG